MFLHLYNSELSQRRGTARSLHLPSPARTNAQLSYFSSGDGGTERAKLENMIFSLHSMRSMSIRDLQITKSAGDTEQPASSTDDASTKWLTVPTIVLLIVGTVPSCTSDLYSSTFPFVFAQDFGIDSETSGQLSAVSNVISFVLLSVFLKLSTKFTLFQYPYDILLLSAVYAIGNILFFIFSAKWTAFSVHLIINRITPVIYGMQTVSRLLLCPPSTFNKVASISSVLSSAGYLSGSALGPVLFTVDKRLPFVVSAALNIMLIVVVVAVYIYRKRILSEMEFDDEVKGQYLLMERAANDPNKSAEDKEMSKLETRATIRMLSSELTATDLAVQWSQF